MGATPPEEIAKQHQEALLLMESGMPCAPRVDRGEIPLRWKERPTCPGPVVRSQGSHGGNGSNDRNDKNDKNGGSSPTEQPQKEADTSDTSERPSDQPSEQPSESVESLESVEVNVVYPDWCISSRGQVDVSPIVDLILEGVDDPAVPFSPAKKSKPNKPNNNKKGSNNGKTKQRSEPPPAYSLTNLWDERNAAHHNVHITRPSHDAWGIKKIILVFCDDFLHTVYTLPWYQPDDQANQANTDTTGTPTHPPSPSSPNSPKSPSSFNSPPSTPSTPSIGTRMHTALQPILHLLQITPRNLVRCLLAALPPNTTIPIHHDTGEWVKYTHRVHVPIIVPGYEDDDPNQVLFRCGPTEQSMERVDCTPGHVFEMNNQAKHAVSNGSETRYRVHLILDYVEDAFLERIERVRQIQRMERIERCATTSTTMRGESRERDRWLKQCLVRRVNLEPGEILTQTRRSIDRVADVADWVRPQPSFLILGAQKAGTTSLYEYLNQHPWVIKAKRRETHCLDWRWDDTLTSSEERRTHCLSFYHAEAMKPHPSLVTGDSTPSYLLDYYRVIPRVKECFCWEGGKAPKFIILTRDPIARAVSHYAMVTSKDGTEAQMAVRGTEWRDKSFLQVIQQDLKHMKEDGLLPYWDMHTMTLDKEIFDKFINSREEDDAWERYVRTRIPLNTGSYSPLGRGMYALQCRQWFRSFPMESFLVMKLEDMSAEDKGVQWVVDRALDHLELPRFEIPDVEKKNSRSYDDPLEEGVKGWLERFFGPQNERFGKMIVEEMGLDRNDWLDPWKYG